jgi:hypothetical protein
MVISLLGLPRMRNTLDKSCTENQNERFVLNKWFFCEKCADYEKMWTKVDTKCIVVFVATMVCYVVRMLPILSISAV